MNLDFLTQKPAIKNAGFWAFGLGTGWILASLTQLPSGYQRQTTADETPLGFHDAHGVADTSFPGSLGPNTTTP
jgi:hypothetical protein